MDISQMIKPSNEQKLIIKCIIDRKNIVVDAVAGSGKTRTVLFIAEQNVEKQVLQITYNKQLKFEVRQKVIDHNIKNLDIHTYHSLCVKYYDKDCHTDEKIIQIISKNISPKYTQKYDILIIDEVQDMTPNYFSLLCKFIRDMKLESNMLILGDRYQGIYEFKNADPRFLTLSNKIWCVNFELLTLQQSFRVTKQIAWFINNVLLGYNRIYSEKEGEHNVYYYSVNIFKFHNFFADIVDKLIHNKYKPSDIFILCPSLKMKVLKRMENMLVQKKIPVYFSINEDDGLDQKLIEGKVVFSTFHQAKGRERKIVFVFGFDNSYFNFFAKEKDKNVCPSELYVACTRSSELLIVIEDSQNNSPLKFLKMKHDQLLKSEMVTFIGKQYIENNENSEENMETNLHKTSVTDLTKYLSENNTNKIIPLLNQLFVIIAKSKKDTIIDIPSSIKTKNGLVEDVSMLNGITIPALYEMKIKGESTMEKILKTKCLKNNDKLMKSIIKETNNIIKQYKNDIIQKHIHMANLYIAVSEHIHSKLKQIDKYNWLSEEIVEKCHQNLEKYIPNNAIYEYELGNIISEYGKKFIYKSPIYGNIEIFGIIDCVDDNTIWELKCVQSLQIEHKLQLLIYSWIWTNIEPLEKKN